MEEWRAVHEAFWGRFRDTVRSRLGDPAWEVHDDEPVVVEWFRLRHGRADAMMAPMDTASLLRELPRVDALLARAGDLVDTYGREATTDSLREVVDRARGRLLEGHADVEVTPAALLAAAGADLAARRPGPPRAVINAAGVVVHTNLGRAPLSEAARAAVARAAGYCDLEVDLDSGRRGSRGSRVDPLVAETCGAEAGIAVNNCAGALVLVLAALARDRDVLVGRGELVEIGGSFRLPDIMAASGARMVEVGTTNRTRAGDYEKAAREADVALILKVHLSNYRITGFVEQPDVAALAAVARSLDVPLVHDVGSGLPTDLPDPWLAGEPSMRGSLAAGADLVLASGDKLLGGPQAGILAGRADLVAACRSHPLARALRLDKLRIAALVATLEAHLRGDVGTVPTWAMLQADAEALRQRATALAERISGRVVDGATLVGGGSAPGLDIPTPLVRIDHPHPVGVARTLRTGDPPIVGRIEDGALWLDLRTVPADLDGLVGDRVRAAAES